MISIVCTILASVIISFQLLTTITSGDTAKQSKSQRLELMQIFGITDSQAHSIQKLALHRTRQIDSLQALNLEKAIFISKREIITDAYYMEVEKVLGPEKSSQIDLKGCRAARCNEIKSLSLGMALSVKMGTLKYKYEDATQQLKQEPLPPKILRSKLSELKRHYYSDVRSLIGEDKYLQWQNYLDGEFDRRYSQKYGMTEEQIAQFKIIKNRHSIKMKQLKHKAISDAERFDLVQAEKCSYTQQVRSIMTEQQFQLWYSDYESKNNNH